MKTLLRKLLKFRKDRDWEKFHTPRNLATSLSVEAGEVLEKFQWKEGEELTKEEIEEIKEEIADVFIYTMLLSHSLGIDLLKATSEKIDKNDKNYPVEKVKGIATKYTKLK